MRQLCGVAMAISKEQAREWAEHFIQSVNDGYEFSTVYEDSDFTDDFPYERDWEEVFDAMVSAKIEVSWDD